MTIIEILRELKSYEIYNDQDWEDYLTSFSQDIVREFSTSRVELTHEIVRRIQFGEHGPPEDPDPSISPKIVTADIFGEDMMRNQMELGVLSGSFDLLHRGHIRGIRYAKHFIRRNGNAKLCTLTLSDENIRSIKGPQRPVLNVNERLRMLSAVHDVDYVILLEEPDCISTLQRLPVTHFFKSKCDLNNEIVHREIRATQSRGGSLELLSENESRIISTTEIIETIRALAVRR